MFEQERMSLRPLPGYEFEMTKCSSVRVSSYSTIRFDTNDYSVPVPYCGCNVSVKGYAERVEVYSKGQMITSHERCFNRHSSIYKLEHYLPILEQRGRAVFNAAPVRQNLPPEFLKWLKKHSADHKELMKLLWDCVNYDWKNVWKNETVRTTEPVIADIVVVPSVDLGKYDLLARQKAGA